MDHASTTPVTALIAARVHALRIELGLSIETLAARSGVGKSTISLIERAESSPTAVILDKLAAALGVPLATLLAAPPGEAPSPLARRADQPVWRDPQSGYLRRSVSPAGQASPMQIVEISFPPGARVTYETGPRAGKVHQQLWVLEGTIDFTIGETTYRLQDGDCLALVLDQPTLFHNPTDRTTRYVVVVVAEPSGRR